MVLQNNQCNNMTNNFTVLGIYSLRVDNSMNLIKSTNEQKYRLTHNVIL